MGRIDTVIIEVFLLAGRCRPLIFPFRKVPGAATIAVIAMFIRGFIRGLPGSTRILLVAGGTGSACVRHRFRRVTGSEFVHQGVEAGRVHRLDGEGDLEDLFQIILRRRSQPGGDAVGGGNLLVEDQKIRITLLQRAQQPAGIDRYHHHKELERQ